MSNFRPSIFSVHGFVSQSHNPKTLEPRSDNKIVIRETRKANSKPNPVSKPIKSTATKSRRSK